MVPTIDVPAASSQVFDWFRAWTSIRVESGSSVPRARFAGEFREEDARVYLVLLVRNLAQGLVENLQDRRL